jgi:proline dehydrogenase
MAEPRDERARAVQAEAGLAALETVEALERRPVRVVRDQGR